MEHNASHLLCSPLLPCRLVESVLSPSQYPSSKLRFFLFYFWISFLMVWCIESVNERASLAPEPAQEPGGSPQAGSGWCPHKGERGKAGRWRPALSRSDLLGVAQTSRYFYISAQHCFQPPTNSLWEVVRSWSCIELFMCILRAISNLSQLLYAYGTAFTLERHPCPLSP